MEETTTRRYLQVARVDSKGKILDFSDPNKFPEVYDPKPDDGERGFSPKFELNYTKYNTETTKAEEKHKHYIDVDVLRLLAWDILHKAKGEKIDDGNYKPLLDEFKGSMVDAVSFQTFGEKKLISRRLTVQFREGMKIGNVYEFRFEAKDGVKGDKGQVAPAKDGKEYLKESIFVPVEAARRAALKILHWLQAKDAAALAKL